MSLEKVCRLFHLSDVHYVHQDTHKALQGMKSNLAVLMKRRFSQGCAPHDDETLHEATKAIRTEITKDPAWPFTYVVVTGDLTTWGDDASLQAAQALFKGLAGSTRSKRATIYGNHDVWPGEEPWFPLLAKPEQIGAALKRVGGIHGPSPYWTIPTSAVTVELHRANTVVADNMLNALAWGKLDVESRVRLQEHCGSSGCVGVALTHHPIHDELPPPTPRTLLDADDCAALLRGQTTRIRLVLSGHTHRVTPPAGSMSARFARGQPPLLAEQLQLTVGTVSQRPESAKAASNAFQMVRLGIEDGASLVVERTVFEQPNGIGSFVKIGADRDRLAEICRLPL